MNDVCLTRCEVKGASRSGKFVKLDCFTQISSESGSPVNCSLSVYMSVDTYQNPRVIQLGLKPGCFLKFTGKTIIESIGTNVHVDMLVETPRRIEYPSKTCEGYIKLFDVNTVPKNSILKCSNRIEMLCNYYNTPDKARYIIIRADFFDEPQIKMNETYNVSGKLMLRFVKDRMLPVIFADTLVKDIRLDERIRIRINNEKKV